VAEKSQRGSLREPLTRSLLALTLGTGLIDAVSYLGLGHVFSANMTGNVVLLGFGIAGTGGLPVLSPVIAAGAFLIGAVLGTRLMAGREPAAEFTVALALEILLLLLAALLAALVDVHSNALSGDTIIAILALAMGTRNAAVRRLGVPDLTTTVLTMTLTGLAGDSRLAGGSGAGTARRLAAVGSMLAGALIGALLVKSSLVAPLLAAAAVTVAALLISRRRPSPAHPAT
jgi:uncharacterized membrane protein YoaK (UPF0700 family)